MPGGAPAAKPAASCSSGKSSVQTRSEGSTLLGAFYRGSACAGFIPRLDRLLEPLQIRVMELSAAAQRFAITFVEPVETSGIEDLPYGRAVAEDSDERSFAGRAVNPERQL